MLTEVEEIVEEQTEEREVPSFNHSFICADIIEQISENKIFKALPELTLDIGNGLTPDVSIYVRNQIKPNFLRDFPKYPEMPLVAIEVISASQNIQDLLEKAQLLVTNGVKAVWTIEPFSNSIFVTTKDGEEIFHNQEVESEGIKVDFRKIFNGYSE
jgi:Uma2 family endonuclease